MKKLMPIAVLAGLAILVVCTRQQAASAGDPGQSADKGIGPVKELKLGPVDQKLADRGKEIFDSKCAACHGLDKAIAGPALGKVLSEQTPEFVMNMILNTAGMEAQNATIKKAMSTYGTSMPSPGLSEQDARAVVEYLRTTK